MKQIGFVILALGVGAVISARGNGTNDGPDFNEVRELIRAQLPGVTDAEVNRAAVEGLVNGLQGRVALGRSAETPATGARAPVISKTDVLDEGVAYLRVGRVGGDLAKELNLALQQAAGTNELKGLALDLRYAGGDDYTAAAATAELFQTKPRRLLDWTGKPVETKGSKTAIKFPVAVLVNGETSGAAEALAAVLRETGAGLILGSRTAGRAMVMREFTLKGGQRVQIASAAVKLGDGSVIPADGLKPDIAVAVKAEDERRYFADAFANLAATNLPAAANLTATNQSSGTNHMARRRMSEAELVRKHREGGAEGDAESATGDSEPEQPALRDPALARAVDLLKGLAVVRQAHAE